MTKENNKDFKNSAKCWICDNGYVDNDVKVKDHCDTTGKCRGSAHKDFNINLKLNDKIPVVLHNLKNCDFHVILQDLGKFSLKINVIPIDLQNYMSYSINNKPSFSDSFQFLSSSLDSLVKNLDKNNFQYLCRKFDNNVLPLVKEK